MASEVYVVYQIRLHQHYCLSRLPRRVSKRLKGQFWSCVVFKADCSVTCKLLLSRSIENCLPVASLMILLVLKYIVEKRKIEHWSNHAKRLTAHDEQNIVTWQSIIYNIPKGTIPFIINASKDTLHTNANLKRWGKRSSAKCTQCQSCETIHHVSNNCKRKLDRFE